MQRANFNVLQEHIELCHRSVLICSKYNIIILRETSQFEVNPIVHRVLNLKRLFV